MDIFEKRKKDILEKLDKSNIGGWDEKIVELCNKINNKKNFYTTSSCSGRIILLKDKDKKAPNLFLFVSHEKVDFKKFIEAVKKIKEKEVSFKQEPCGLHIACRNLDEAQEILDKARKIGWKKSGIISSKKRYIIELFGTAKLEFPIISKGKVLVDESFLRVALEKANKNLEKSWKQIKELERIF
ncbi:MAG: hypothetical protein KC516_04285 [Nanoarchaeota archaeon]|nr:hypothetical protein [Nanoarchaeota archaeon]